MWQWLTLFTGSVVESLLDGATTLSGFPVQNFSWVLTACTVLKPLWHLLHSGGGGGGMEMERRRSVAAGSWCGSSGFNLQNLRWELMPFFLNCLLQCGHSCICE